MLLRSGGKDAWWAVGWKALFLLAETNLCHLHMTVCTFAVPLGYPGADAGLQPAATNACTCAAFAVAIQDHAIRSEADFF